MGKLVRLSSYRERRSPLRAAPAEPPRGEHPLYYCTRCGAERFTLGSQGEVQCAGCGALMRNLEVRDER